MFLSPSKSGTNLWTQTEQFTFGVQSLNLCIVGVHNMGEQNVHIRNSFMAGERERERERVRPKLQRTCLCTIVNHTHTSKTQTGCKL